jgi:hypothetical protein
MIKLLGARQHIRRAHRRTCLAKRRLVRLYHAQVAKTEIAHRPRGRANIERIARSDQHDAQTIDFRELRQGAPILKQSRARERTNSPGEVARGLSATSALERFCGSASFVVQIGANCDGTRRVNRGAVELDVLDHALLVDDERGAARKFILIRRHGIFLQNAVIGEHFAIHVAEQRKGDLDLFGKCGVGGWAVCADSENYGVAGFDFG